MERKETDIISGTDMNLVSEVEQQYYDVLKILIDPELEGLKSRIQVKPWLISDSLHQPHRASRHRRKSHPQMQNDQGRHRGISGKNRNK